MQDRVIFHIDINHCYAQIEEMKYPDLRNVPMAVGGHEEKRQGIILAKNDLAKRAGVITGESLREARSTCPDLLIIPPAYEDYIAYTQQVKSIYREYTDHVESFGLDEAWLDYTDSINLFGDPLEAAYRIQDRVLQEIGLTVSVGVSWNKVFAKLGSDMKKPSGMTVITKENYRNLVWPLPASDLLYVGYATSRKLRERGITTIGDLAGYPVRCLKKAMGTAGELISAFANGNDQSPVQESFYASAPKSVGNSMTLIHDVKSLSELKPAAYVIAEAVASRLKDAGMEGDVITVSMRSSGLDWYMKQARIPSRTSLSNEILEVMMTLISQEYDFNDAPLRAVGVSVSNLHPWTGIHQMSFFVDEHQREQIWNMDNAMDAIREKYGFSSIRRACTLVDRRLTDFSPKQDHTVHPTGYFQGRRMSSGII
ncbi:MAG: DNA polymerase IV [Solobacterium sp.]|jgi:DNA polymerase-4|nr:DNA polymerase IV [Solobacterium sp.]